MGQQTDAQDAELHEEEQKAYHIQRSAELGLRPQCSEILTMWVRLPGKEAEPPEKSDALAPVFARQER